MKQYIIYFGGGTMKGVFSAGVATAFQKHNLYPHVDAVYGASAGVMTGAYFLSQQMQLGATVYWEDLPSQFISPKNGFIGALQRFQDRFISPVQGDIMRDAVNIDYLMHILKNKKILNTKKIFAQKIPLYVKLFNLDTHTVEYKNACQPEIFEILRAGINILPYTHEPSTIDNTRYIDGAIMDIIGFEYLRKTHPNHTILIVLNGSTDRKRRYKYKNIIEGVFMRWMLRDPRFTTLLKGAEKRLRADIMAIEKDPNALLITPPNDILSSRTTSLPLLKESHTSGIQVTEHILTNKL